MFFVILIGLILRLSFIDKPEGLWNDEYVSWMVANTPFFNGFFKTILSQCHMPVYYLYLKPFTNYSDIVLRLSSVFPGVFSIVSMYFVGKLYSKKIGLYSAIITSVLSFLIYYSQEVRLYSFLFFISTISLFYTIKLIHEKNRKNICGYIISNLVLIFTHTLGIIFVFFNALYVLYKLKKDKIKISKEFFFSAKFIISVFFLICLMIIFSSLANNIISQHHSAQWWGHFSYTNILFLFTDYFSPVLTNHINAPPIFFYDKSLAYWMIIPTIIGIIGIFFGIKNNKGIAVSAFITLIVLFILAKFGFIVFVTKYSIEILPILIIIISCGFSRLKINGILLLILFSAIHLAYLFTPNYVTKLPRTEGHKIVSSIIKERKPQKIIFTYYDENRFRRYLNLEKIPTFYISKMNRHEYVTNPERILDNIDKGETFSIVFLDSVSFLPDDNSLYFEEKIPEMFVTFSKIKNKLTKTISSDKDYSILNYDTIGSWSVVTAIKTR